MATKSVSKLEDLTPDQRNANKGTARGRALLEDSVRRFGAGRSVLADRDGNLIAGNKTHEVAVDVGLKVRVVETAGDELVVVKRTDLSLDDPHDRRARELAFADNRVAELDLDWDADELAAARDAGVDLDAVGFRDDELVALLAPDVEITDDDAKPQREPEVKSEKVVEIYCSAADLDEFESTLALWSKRVGVTVNISS
jgi:hypothetical protein